MTSQAQWQAIVASIRQKYDNLSHRARAALLVWAAVQVGLVALVWWYTPRKLFESAYTVILWWPVIYAC